MEMNWKKLGGGLLAALTFAPQAEAALVYADCGAGDAPLPYVMSGCSANPLATADGGCSLSGTTLDCDYGGVGTDIDLSAWLLGQYQSSTHDYVVFGEWDDGTQRYWCCTIDDMSVDDSQITRAQLLGTNWADQLSFIWEDLPSVVTDRLKPAGASLEAMQRGHAGLDTLRGSDWGTGYAEMLFGETGDDTIFGNGGADYLHGDGGSDTIYGEAGDDIIYGGVDDDQISGGGGGDIIAGGDGDDIILGGPGHDIIDGRDGLDDIEGGDGDDVILAENMAMGDGGDADFVDGGDGDDVVCANVHRTDGNGGDYLYGGEGNDVVFYQSVIGLGDPAGAIDGEDGTDDCCDSFQSTVDCEGTLTSQQLPAECAAPVTSDCEDLACLY